MMTDDADTDEWSSARVLSSLQSESVSVLQDLSSLCASGEIRDFDDLFTDPTFYARLIGCVRSAWRAHDHATLGGIGEDEHENFLYAQEREREARGHRAIVDDEEDEARELDGDSAAWTRLQAAYTILTRVMAVPEFNVTVAARRGAFDASFAGALLQRFEPKFRKKAASGPDRSHAGVLTSVTGVGGVAMGSGLSPSGAAAAASSYSPLSRVPASILSMVGIGVKHVEPDSPQPAELALLRGVLHTVYSKFFTLRPTLRQLMSNFLARFLRVANYPQGVSQVLNVYGAIVKGLTLPMHPQHRDFLMKSIMPLHQPNQMMNELSPVVSAYHEALVYVLIQFLEKEAATGTPEDGSSLCETIMTRILLGWPTAQSANSPKEVLLLHECEKILEYCRADSTGSSPTQDAPSSQFHRIIDAFLPYIIQCISSYNHRVAERALQLWQNDKFLTLCSHARTAILPALMPCLVNEEKHWNKSVNKMRGIVLGLFRDMDLVLFTRVAHQYFLQRAAATQADSNFTPVESLARIDALIASLRPVESVTQQTAEQKLLETQVRVAANLPAQVKYSDFVFGHVLGEGSFSCVRYAKWIRRGELPSAWPEYAVKILSKELVAQQKYEANVAREIRIMNALVHENINRLVALCDNATNTYLVLEYAPKGDLHTHISKLGSLDTDSARFVAAEILRAMEEIHRNVRDERSVEGIGSNRDHVDVLTSTPALLSCAHLCRRLSSWT